MTKVLKKFKFRRVYPWENWTDGRAYEARRNKDYTCKTESFRVRLFGVAKRRGLRVSTSNLTKDSIIFQFSKPEESQVKPLKGKL